MTETLRAVFARKVLVEAVAASVATKTPVISVEIISISML